MTDLRPNRFYRVGGVIVQYLGRIQGVYVFEDEGGEYVSFNRQPTVEPIAD